MANNITGTDFSALSTKLARAGHALKLAIDNEKAACSMYDNARKTRATLEIEYYVIRTEIDTLTGL